MLDFVSLGIRPCPAFRYVREKWPADCILRLIARLNADPDGWTTRLEPNKHFSPQPTSGIYTSVGPHHEDPARHETNCGHAWNGNIKRLGFVYTGRLFRKIGPRLTKGGRWVAVHHPPADFAVKFIEVSPILIHFRMDLNSSKHDRILSRAASSSTKVLIKPA
jgi:hypothetical protein